MKSKSKSKGFKPPKDQNNPTIEEFAKMVESHDPTYVWSRDEAERLAGAAERKIIDTSRRILGDQATVPVWNRALQKKVVPSMMDEFFWRFSKESKSA
jgi:hypothetical protein